MPRLHLPSPPRTPTYFDNDYKLATNTRTAAKNTVYIQIEKYSPRNQQFGESD